MINDIILAVGLSVPDLLVEDDSIDQDPEYAASIAFSETLQSKALWGGDSDSDDGLVDDGSVDDGSANGIMDNLAMLHK